MEEEDRGNKREGEDQHNEGVSKDEVVRTTRRRHNATHAHSQAGRVVGVQLKHSVGGTASSCCS